MFITTDSKKTPPSPLLIKCLLGQGFRSLIAAVCSVQKSFMNTIRKNNKIERELANRCRKIRKQKISERIALLHILQTKEATTAPSLAPR